MVILTLLDPQNKTPLQQWHFPYQSLIRIGRASDNEIVLDQFAEVSRHHLELRQNTPDSPWQLISYGTNGTFLDGILVSQKAIANRGILQLAKEGPLLQFEIQTPVAQIPQNPCCTPENNPPNSLFCIHCGQPLAPQEKLIRQYQILRTLGQGGMGTTYLAWDKTGSISGHPLTFVLKEMNADMERIPKARELFEREARILKTLDHPGIPKYYDFFVHEGKKYLGMELVHGQNLEQRIYKEGPLTPQQGIEWMIQACNILEYLHSLRPPLVHRDVKPANLMVRNLDNRIVLLDFGAVKEIGTPPGTRIGAEGYSAPEQDRGQPCPQSDIYAIGATLVFLLTRDDPMTHYHRKDNQYCIDVTGILAHREADLCEIAPQLAQVIEQACAPNPRKRFSTAQELAKALESCV
ncbi:protein kinase [Lusitaniella coriacea LEGE 07157]|uniref:Protein kinase n=1 Tax=Lusitaniella coriacea LEGE 07157 TaxID=945747 RepID=A0A8J7AZ39_9CYAN|nr:protein kinase [Lusitaniella coriacea]MBE9115304.1 protein kinase [Lusitaniella coriacea LEGE 07157]